MSARPGGEADKLGNRYEATWAIHYALFCIADDSSTLTLEDIDPELNNGAEFTYRARGKTEVHQLKRQTSRGNAWSLRALKAQKVFMAAEAHVAGGREYHFVSSVPCGELQTLADRARKSADAPGFRKSWLTNETLNAAFDELSSDDYFGSDEAAWATLRGMWFQVQTEIDVARENSVLAESRLEGAEGHLIALAIHDILLSTMGRPMDKAELVARLAEHNIVPRTAGSSASIAETIRSATSSWLSTVRDELLQPVIERQEAGSLLEALRDDRLCLVAGTAGGGKSAVLEQVVGELQSTGAPVLALRLDRFESFASSIGLGHALGFETSPASALAAASGSQDAYLVIDQLDAVSLASGRMPQSFDVISSVIREALSFPNLRVVIACREFDIENDHRIRALGARSDLKTIKVGTLKDEEVTDAVEAMGLDPARLTGAQRRLLKVPVHLVLLKSIAGQEDALAFQSKGSLFEAFWKRKHQMADIRRPGVRFSEVIARVANAASDRQRLSVPVEVLDEGNLSRDADVLVSEHVLARDGDLIAFFHESFFDYAFARQWVFRDESLVDFLTRAEQELFRRGQVRQILQHLREREPERFLEEMESLLTSADIRFHVKDSALAVLGSLSSLTHDDAEMVLRVADTNPDFEGRLWQQLRRATWFERFHEDGFIAAWLDGPDDDRRRNAVEIMTSGTNSHGDAVAELLAKRQDADDYGSWLRFTVRHADLHQNRPLFDLLLEAIQQGRFDDAEHELWLVVHDLGEHRPLWAIEVLEARLMQREGALAVNQEGKIADLEMREYSATELAKAASAAEPLAFAETFVAYLRVVVAATVMSSGEGKPIRDKHFGLRWPEQDHDERQLDDAILAGCVRSLEVLATSTPEEIRPLLEALAADPYDTSQFLLYKALIAGAATFADWAADLLLEGESRLDCGYASDSDWVARELARAIAPYIDDQRHQQLEESFRDLTSEYESREGRGIKAFTFLTALEESRLTDMGRRRLGEYQRKFDQDSPRPPRGITGGSVNSPIGQSATAKMSDEQWLRAMRRYDKEEHDWSTFKGGARELSSSLRARVMEDPDRFARLALRLTADINPAYGDAVLLGLGEAGPVSDPEAAYAAIRHIASLGHSDNDRWLGMALRKYYESAPIDLVELVLDRALNSPDPADSKPVIIRGDGDGKRAEDLRMNGINTTRGSLAEALGDLLVHDVDGTRTELVKPHLTQLASDPVLSVRSCVAHTLAACLKHARSDVVPAFQILIDTDDVLLAAQLVTPLMLYIGNVEPEIIDPVIQRMLTSEDDEAREAGGRLAAFAALEWNRPVLMVQAMESDRSVRIGVAEACAQRVDRTSNVQLAASTLERLMNDEDDEVRKASAEIAPRLRGLALGPYKSLLTALIESKAYDHATPQLLLTLQYAPDKVDDLVLLAAQRFLSVFGSEAGDIRTGAAGDAHYISELVVRGLTQSRNRPHRSALLDVLDELLLLGVYGIGDAIADAERL